jgi:two-component system, NtrC family, sensor kinase
MTNSTPVDSQLRDFVAAVAVPCAVHAGGQMIAINRALIRLSSRSEDELLSLPFEALLRVEERETVTQAGLVCLTEKAIPPSFAAMLLTPQGGERPVWIRAMFSMCKRAGSA